MSYYLSVIKDSPLAFWKLDESSGSIAFDSSGCDNNALYVGGISRVSLPLVRGGGHANKITSVNTIQFDITKDYYGKHSTNSLGVVKTEDNDFSIELWFHPKDISEETRIFADSNGIGLYWNNGNIVFKLENEVIEYTVRDKRKSFYIVATYSPGIIQLYVDAKLVAFKEIQNFNFTNETLSFFSGPSEVSKYFLIDSPAVYRYALSLDKIKMHHRSTVVNEAIQSVASDKGEIFRSTLQHQYDSDKFMYPIQKDWKFFENDDLMYVEESNSLRLKPSSNFGSFIQEIGLVYWKDYVSSKIEWFGGEGINVYVSYDETNWHICSNGSYLPLFHQGSNIPDQQIIFFKVEFSSIDATKYIPEIYYLGIYFYEKKKLYSHNGNSYIETSSPNSGSNWDIDLSNREESILARHYDDGIRSMGAGFFIDTVNEVFNIEMFVTPKSLSSGYLFYNKTDGVEYSLSWEPNGDLIKSNISNLYINGQDISSQTNIYSYIEIDEPNYILIKLSDSISGKIWINTKSENNVRSGSLDNNIYKYISIYEEEEIDHTIHYNTYIGRHYGEVLDSGFTVSELEPESYPYDWVIVNNA